MSGNQFSAVRLLAVDSRTTPSGTNTELSGGCQTRLTVTSAGTLGQHTVGLTDITGVILTAREAVLVREAASGR